MKLSAKKRGEIYDTVHERIYKLRIELREWILRDSELRNKIDLHLSQLEAPIAQDIMKLLDPNYK